MNVYILQHYLTNKFYTNLNIMKKIITSLALGLASFGAWAQLADVSVSGPSTLATTNGNITLKVSVSGMNFSILGANWEVSDASIASLSDASVSETDFVSSTVTSKEVGSIKLNAKRNGSVTVSGTLMTENETITGMFAVEVSNQIMTLALSGPSSTMFSTTSAGAVQLDLVGDITFAGSNVTYSVSDGNGTVSESGLYSPKMNGVVTITAMSKADNTVMSNSIEIVVSGYVAITGISATPAATLLTTYGQSSPNAPAITWTPLDASKVTATWSSSDDCGLKIDGGNGQMTAKRNGVYTITARVRNSNSDLTTTFTVTVSGQLPMHETFPGTWDGNPFGGVPAGYKLRFNNITGQYAGGYNGWMGSVANDQYFLYNGFMNSGSVKEGTTTDKLDLYWKTSDASFPDMKPFWEGVGAPYFTFQDAGGPWFLGCGQTLEGTNKELWIDIENTTITSLELQSIVYDQNRGDFNGASGVADVKTVLGNTRALVKVTLPSSMTTLKGLRLATKSYEGRVIIRSFTVGADVPTSASFTNSPSISDYKGQTTLNHVVTGEGNIVNQASFTMMSSTEGIATMVSSTSNSVTIMATGTGNGTVTLMGHAFGNDTLMSTKVVQISNQLVEGVNIDLPNTIELGVLPNTVSTALDFTTSPLASYKDSVVVVYSVASEPTGIASYNEDENSLVVSGLGVVTVTGAVSKAPDVTIMFASGAETTSKVVTVTGTVGVKNLVKSSDLSIYPNPATEEVNVRVANAIVKNVRILTTSGSVVLSKSFASKLSVSGFVPGAYIMEVSTDKGVARKLFTVK